MTNNIIYDDLGFKYQWDSESINYYNNILSNNEKKKMIVWAEYLDSLGGIDNINISDSKFKKLVRKGIPTVFRTQVWCKIAKVDIKMLNKPTLYRDTLLVREAVPTHVLEAIDKDVKRTFIGAKGFKSTQLTNVLCAFAIIHPEIGYCQSLNFLAAVLISCCGEEPALWLLLTLVEEYLPSEYYQGVMKGFSIDLKMIELLINERTPDIGKHFLKLRHEWVMTSSGWLLTLFSNTFPIPTVLRIWDSLFLEGPKIVFRIAISFIRIHQEILLSQPNLSQLTLLLTHLQSNFLDQDKLMDIAFSIKYFSREHLIELREKAKRIISGSNEEFSGNALHSLFGQFNM